MELPLLAGSSSQHSAFISQSLYESLLTRTPVPDVASITPPATFQLASPMGDQPSRLLPSNKLLEPAWANRMPTASMPTAQIDFVLIGIPFYRNSIACSPVRGY